jgi:geranylgeranyl pyrophosphate synthase
MASHHSHPTIEDLRATLDSLKSDPEADAQRAAAMEQSLDAIRATLQRAEDLRNDAARALRQWSEEVAESASVIRGQTADQKDA